MREFVEIRCRVHHEVFLEPLHGPHAARWMVRVGLADPWEPLLKVHKSFYTDPDSGQKVYVESGPENGYMPTEYLVVRWADNRPHRR